MSGAPPRAPTPDVRALTPDEVERLLQRLRLDPPALDLDGLTALQWRTLCATPFHNVDLLAGCSPRTVEAIIAAMLAGRGGPCHVQAVGFLALLRGLGFRAWLAAATIGAPGDHLVCVVELGGRRVICDVGNGHPYRRPFPLDGRVEIEHVGWRFIALGDGERLTLSRDFGRGDWRTVYTVDPTPRAFADFVPIIDAHHAEAGFGPFLTGLRAARIGDASMVTLRDLRYRREGRGAPRERRVADLVAARRVLRRVFDLDGPEVDAALARLEPHASGWVSAPPRPARIAVTISTTDRPAALAALLGDLSAEWARTRRRADPPLVLVVENSVDPAARAADRVAVHRATATLDARFVDDGVAGRAIAESRRAQTRALAACLAAGEPVDAVWMLDDDLRLAQLRAEGGVLRRCEAIRYFDRIADAWDAHPEAGLLVGRVCGDPPIRPDAVLATGLLDLAANLDRFVALDPEALYRPPTDRGAFALPDYYYDHSRIGDAHLHHAFYWLPRAAGQTVRAAALDCVRALCGLFVGRAPTRPLLDDPRPASRELRRCHLRGGHAVFLDVDAFLRHRYPAVELGDGTLTRRADMVGATLLDREPTTFVAAFDAPVLHARSANGPTGGRLADLRSEFFGVMLARAVIDDGGRVDRVRLAERARARRARIVDRLALAHRRAAAAAVALDRAASSWLGADPELAAALTTLRAELSACPALTRPPADVAAALDTPDDLERVAHAIEALP